MYNVVVGFFFFFTIVAEDSLTVVLGSSIMGSGAGSGFFSSFFSSAAGVGNSLALYDTLSQCALNMLERL